MSLSRYWFNKMLIKHWSIFFKIYDRRTMTMTNMSAFFENFALRRVLAYFDTGNTFTNMTSWSLNIDNSVNKRFGAIASNH